MFLNPTVTLQLGDRNPRWNVLFALASRASRHARSGREERQQLPGLLPH